MARKKKTKSDKPKKSIGDRIVQIVLLAVIVLGIAGVIGTLGGGSGGAPGGAPGGMPGGTPAGAPAGTGPGAPGAAAENRAVAVETCIAGLADVSEYIRVNGDVDAESSVNIYPDVSGKVTSLSVSLGDTVRRGQTIGYVDPSVPGQVYSTSAVNSTITGTITSLNYDVGETVNSQTPIAVVGNLDDLEIVTFVPERYVGSLEQGLTAQVALDAYPGEVFDAVVTEISPVLDASSRTVQVTLSPVNYDSRIKVGMFASIRIVIARSEGTVSVPPAAVTSYYGQDVVYVIENGRAVMRNVAAGLVSTDAVEITDGLEAGEEIVLRGLSGVTDGAVVRVVNQG